MKKKSAKRIQLDFDALEAEIMAELEGPSESPEAAAKELPTIQERPKEEKDDDADDHTSQEEQEKEIYKTENTKSSEEDEGHTASNGTKLRAAHTPRLAPETRTIVSMKGNN